MGWWACSEEPASNPTAHVSCCCRKGFGVRCLPIVPVGAITLRRFPLRGSLTQTTLRVAGLVPPRRYPHLSRLSKSVVSEADPTSGRCSTVESVVAAGLTLAAPVPSLGFFIPVLTVPFLGVLSC
jgi:hypothetical protein